MKIIQGDILDVRSGVILHQVNCRKVCGGLAGALRRKFPIAFEVYFDDSRTELERLGTILIGEQFPELSIVHLYGQFNPGANTDLIVVEKALKRIPSWLIEENQLTLYAPFQMGCGLGGGDWKLYSALLEKYLPTLTVIQKYP